MKKHSFAQLDEQWSKFFGKEPDFILVLIFNVPNFDPINNLNGRMPLMNGI